MKNLSEITLALTGNPNAGKTSLFNALTGSRQHVGNYPGVTVEKKEGISFYGKEKIRVVDLPGTYSLTAYSLEEMVARNYLIGDRPDIVVNVVDTANLERNLYLTIQLLELGVPLIICLNMFDVAEQRGMKINLKELSQLLNTPVISTVGRTGEGVNKLLQIGVELARKNFKKRQLKISYGFDVDQGIEKLKTILEGGRPRQGLLSARWLALKCLEHDVEILGKVKKDSQLGHKLLAVIDKITEHIRVTLDDDTEGVIADYRYGFITAIIKKVVLWDREVRIDFSDRVDRVLTNRLFGPAFLLIILYMVYQFVFWASEGPVEYLQFFFKWIVLCVEKFVPPGALISLLVSGVIDGVGGVLGFVPIIMFMFFAISIMEDSGYMTRVAYLMDRILRVFGLHGHSVIALIVGGGISGGCAVPGIMSTRTLKDVKARLITILILPFMNCGAKLSVYSILIGAFFVDNKAEMLFGLTLLSWVLALIGAKLLRWTVLSGEQAPFVMELPPYRTPTMKGLLIHTWERTWEYVKKAGTLILGVSVLMWIVMSFPVLSLDEEKSWDQRINEASSLEEKEIIKNKKASAGLAKSMAGRVGCAITNITDPLGFDWRTNVALIGGFAAKEVIVSTLGTAYSLGEIEIGNQSLTERLQNSPDWNPLKAISLMIFVMVYAPCVATIMVMKKETGSWKWAFFSLSYNTLIAYLLTFLVYQGGLLILKY